MTRYLTGNLQAGHGCFRWLLLVPAAEGTRGMPRTRPVGWALPEAPRPAGCGRDGSAVADCRPGLPVTMPLASRRTR
jgi:hypothetical protein